MKFYKSPVLQPGTSHARMGEFMDIGPVFFIRKKEQKPARQLSFCSLKMRHRGFEPRTT